MAPKRATASNVPSSVRNVELLSNGPSYASRHRPVRAPSPAASLRTIDRDDDNDNGSDSDNDNDSNHNNTRHRPVASSVTRTSSNGRPNVSVASSLMPPPSPRRARVARSPSSASIHSDDSEHFRRYLVAKGVSVQLSPVQLSHFQQQLQQGGVESSRDSRFTNLLRDVQYITADDYQQQQRDECNVPSHNHTNNNGRSCIGTLLRLVVAASLLVAILVMSGRWPTHWNADRLLRIFSRPPGGYVSDPGSALEDAFKDQPILTVQSSGVHDSFITLALHHDRVATMNRPLRPLCMMVTSSSTPSPHATGAPSPSSSSSTTMLPVSLAAIASSVFTTNDRVLSIFGSDYAEMKWEDMDKDISARIDAHFATSKYGAVVINNVELLPKPQALLWRYCDDDRAMHPRATFIFSGSGPNLASCEPNDITKAARDKTTRYFESLWGRDSSAAQPHFDALWTRMANPVVPLCAFP